MTQLQNSRLLSTMSPRTGSHTACSFSEGSGVVVDNANGLRVASLSCFPNSCVGMNNLQTVFTQLTELGPTCALLFPQGSDPTDVNSKQVLLLKISQTNRLHFRLTTLFSRPRLCAAMRYLCSVSKQPFNLIQVHFSPFLILKNCFQLL